MTDPARSTLACRSHGAVAWRGDVVCAACGHVSLNASGTSSDVRHPDACPGCGRLLAREARPCCRGCALPVAMARARARGCA